MKKLILATFITWLALNGAAQAQGQKGGFTGNSRPAPSSFRPAPAMPRPAPTSFRPAPVASRPPPVASRPAPVASRPPPVASRPAPVASRPPPVAPSPAASTPFRPNLKPVASKPSTGNGKPSTGKPSNGNGKPSTGKPTIGGNGKPSTGKPTIGGNGKPTAGKPTAGGNGKPTAGKPTAGGNGGRPVNGKAPYGQRFKDNHGKFHLYCHVPIHLHSHCWHHSCSHWTHFCHFDRFQCQGCYCPNRCRWFYWYEPFYCYLPCEEMQTYVPVQCVETVPVPEASPGAIDNELGNETAPDEVDPPATAPALPPGASQSPLGFVPPVPGNLNNKQLGDEPAP